MLLKWLKKEKSFKLAESFRLKKKNEYFRERVDFGEIIGYDVHPGTLEKTPTSWGIILQDESCWGKTLNYGYRY